MGKTTIGEKVAEFLGINFFDLDHEIERFFQTGIQRLQKRFITVRSFRKKREEGKVPQV